MQYRALGRTGVQVSSLVLGAMNFGAMGRTTQDEVTAIVDAALDGGINLIDTAGALRHHHPCSTRHCDAADAAAYSPAPIKAIEIDQGHVGTRQGLSV